LCNSVEIEHRIHALNYQVLNRFAIALLASGASII
jgi:hypothetical protein